METVLQENMVLLSSKTIDNTKTCINNIIKTENNILNSILNENINEIKNENTNEIKNENTNEIKNENINEIKNENINEIKNENLELEIYYKNIENVNMISNISKDFNSIKILVDETNQLLKLINNKIEILKKNHSIFLEESKVSDNITLDSFLFQSSILDENLNNKKNIFSRIQNKIYSDYYKLYKNISKFYFLIIKDNIENKEIEKSLLNKDYIPYNDLDKHFVYDFNNIIKLNKDILGIINFIIELIKQKSQYIKQKEKSLSIGYDIDFLVNYENYNKSYLINTLNLYTNNISINNCLHYKYLLTFYSQLKYFYLLIVKHISFEDENIYSNFYKFHDKIDHNLINTIINIDNNIIDITSHLYKKTNNVSIQTDNILLDATEKEKEKIKITDEIKNTSLNENENEYDKETSNIILTELMVDEKNKDKPLIEKIFFCNIL